MAEERDVRKSMDTLAKQLTMDVDSLKSQHNRLYSQVGRGGQCAQHNTYPQLVVLSIVSHIAIQYMDCTYWANLRSWHTLSWALFMFKGIHIVQICCITNHSYVFKLSSRGCILKNRVLYSGD